MTITVQSPPPTRPRNRPRRLGVAVYATIGCLIAVATIGWTGYTLLSVLVRQQSSATASYDGVRSITVDGGSVDLTVAGGAGATTRFDEKLDWSFRRPTVTVTRGGDHLSIDGRCPTELAWSCTVHVGLMVPAATSITVRSGSGNIAATGLTSGATLRTSDGDVTATSIGGALDARSSSGDVTVKDARGNVTAQSSDGDVTIAGSQADRVVAETSNGNVNVQLDASPSTVRATSDDGNVTVTLPNQPGIAYHVAATTSNGTPTVSVSVDPSSPRQITARSSNGDVIVRYG